MEMNAIFVADVHVSAARPEAVAQFEGLLRSASAVVDVIYVLGDLFDQWLGDDDMTPPYGHVEQVLNGVAATGVDIYVQHGNHDFLLGEEFAARAGCHLLSEEVVIDLDGTATLLMHGDSLCTDDEEYQAYRAYTRDLENQRLFLSKNLEERAAIATQLRHESAALKQLKTEEIMDVSVDAVCAALERHDVSRLIHGHTHRPAVHHFTLPDGTAAQRLVLGDWYRCGQVAVQLDGSLSLLPVPEALTLITHR